MGARSVILMRAVCGVLLMAGCGLSFGPERQAPAERNETIVGTWSSIDTSPEVILQFNVNRTMTCRVPRDSRFAFWARYAYDPDPEPATLDLIEVTSSAFPGDCLAIVRFPEEGVLELSGEFGMTPDRPTEFTGDTDLTLGVTRIHLRLAKTTFLQ